MASMGYRWGKNDSSELSKLTWVFSGRARFMNTELEGTVCLAVPCCTMHRDIVTSAAILLAILDARRELMFDRMTSVAFIWYLGQFRINLGVYGGYTVRVIRRSAGISSS